MAQALLQLKAVWEWVQSHGMKSKFTDALDACCDLVFEDFMQRSGEPKLAWRSTLNETYANVTGHELCLRLVTVRLGDALSEYNADKSRPLPYEMYEKFVRACRSWGYLVQDRVMQEFTTEEKALYESRSDRYKQNVAAQAPEAPQPAQLVEAARPAVGETNNDKIMGLLEALKSLAESTERKVDVLYNAREQKDAAARQKENEKREQQERRQARDRAQAEAAEEQRKMDEERRAADRARAYGVLLD